MAILTGGDLTLLLVTQFVLKLNPWFITRYMIPLAGMIFASSIPMASSHIFPISMPTHRNKELNLQSVNYREEYVISYKKEIKKLRMINSFIGSAGGVAIPMFVMLAKGGIPVGS